MVSGKTYEMLWRCGFCGTEKLLGKTHRHCPQCGAPQDPATRYFPQEHEKVAVEDHVYVGADRLCPSCQAPSGAKAVHCGACGAPLEGAAEVARVADGAATRPAADGRSSAAAAEPVAPLVPPAAPKRRRLGWILGLTAAGVVVAALAVTMLWTRRATFEITGHSWARTIHIEQLRTVDGGDWCDSKPSDARSVHSSRRQRSTRDVANGETCHTERVDQGDGTFREERRCATQYRQEPVYDRWCDYVVDRWVASREQVARGSASSPAPQWPAATVDGCARLGCERLGRRDEVYTVHLVERGAAAAKPATCDLAQDRWGALAVAAVVGAEVRVVTGGIACDSIHP